MYGAIFAFLSIGIIGGSQLTHVFARYWPAEKILGVCLVMQVLSGLIFVVGMFAGWYGLGATIVCLLLLLTCSGVIYPSAAALALSPFSKNAGTAAAMFGFLQIGIGGLISASPALLPMSGSQATALIMLGSSLIAFIAFFIGGRYRNLTNPAL
jgi:DHA1 family bicyclomycin/chloramphenicol resistance-like MFS transporter